MNEIIEKDINIENMIYEINEKEVMLDTDAVKNNPDKFPKRFSWVITDEEKNNLRSKFSVANISHMSRSKY